LKALVPITKFTYEKIIKTNGGMLLPVAGIIVRQQAKQSWAE